MSQVDLAEALGVHVTTMNRIERKSSVPSGARLEQIAKILRVRPDELVGGSDKHEVPVMGYIGAGAEIEPEFEQVPPEGLHQVEIPFPVPDGIVAFEVRGDSMLPRFNEGDVILVFTEQRRPIYTFFGEEAAVRTMDGRRYLKQIMRDGDDIALLSWNARPITGVALEWIGEIFTIIPASQFRRTKVSSALRSPA
ncbi:helix-turn-helix transcriptional regulator [Aurantimonas sp. DM33-3]|nr:helix-turn-helix transcriptional regulator [Aurantimonas sp. DM33-3]